MKIGIVTLGCDKNSVDSEYIAGVLDEAGIQVESAGITPEQTELYDAVVINTCGFVESAKSQSVQAILSWLEYKASKARKHKRCRVFVVGCLAQRYAADLGKELPEVDGFLGVGEFEAVLRLVRSPHGTVSMVDPVGKDQPQVEGRSRFSLFGQSAYAYLKISDGCSHSCTFCAIPEIKGPIRSVPKEILLEEARSLISRGVREINIVAQDTSQYGRDLYGRKYGICELLRDLAQVPGKFWLRILYFYPGGVTDEFIRLLAGAPKIVPYLDMPLQHLHPEVLQRMKRPHLEANTSELVERLRRAVPGIALRTTFITGFTGESEEHFEFLCQGIEELRFERMGAFPYSPEEGTSSYKLRPLVPKRQRQARWKKIMSLQSLISQAYNESRVGTTIPVLVEERIDDGTYLARSAWDAPDVDGNVIVHCDHELKVADFANVLVASAETYDLHATPVKAASTRR